MCFARPAGAPWQRRFRRAPSGGACSIRTPPPPCSSGSMGGVARSSRDRSGRFSRTSANRSNRPGTHQSATSRGSPATHRTDHGCGSAIGRTSLRELQARGGIGLWWSQASAKLLQRIALCKRTASTIAASRGVRRSAAYSGEDHSHRPCRQMSVRTHTSPVHAPVRPWSPCWLRRRRGPCSERRRPDGRRMAQTAAHHVDRVIPPVPCLVSLF